VFKSAYRVDELKGDRAVLNKNGICSPFKVGDLVIVNSASSAPAPSTPTQKTIKIKSGTWNIRSGAGINYPSKGTMKGGVTVAYIETKNGWYKLTNGYWIGSAAIQK